MATYPIERVETQRLLLRKPREADLAAVLAIHGDPATNRFNPRGPASPAECEKLLSEWLEHWKVNNFGYWSASLLESTKDIVGFGGIKRSADHELNLYFRFAPSSWGRGYATELGAAALARSAALHCGPVRARVRVSNTPSQRALTRLGMALVGEIAGAPGEEASLLYEAQGAEQNAT